MDWGAALRAARPAAGVEGSEAARWAREAGGRRTRAKGGGGRRTWARGGGGRRRAASRARATAGGVEGEGGRPSARQRTSGEMEATGRAVVFIAPPPLVAVGEATRD